MKAAVAIFFVFTLAIEAWAQSGVPVAPGVLKVGRLRHFAISESSGLAASRRYPGVIWTHNDGGFQFLFAVRKSGELVGAFEVPGNLIDWEDIAADNAGYLYLADTGTNGMVRTHVAVHQVREPDPYKRYGNAKIVRSWFLKFPDGIQDCEAFVVHGGYGYLIAKRRVNDRVKLYRYSLADRSHSISLQIVARIPVSAGVAAADISPDGRRLGLVTDEGVHIFLINGRPVSAVTAPNVFTPFLNSFTEGGTFLGGGFLVSAETRQLWLFTNDLAPRPQPWLRE
jgi:hypothetical protein